ncbi:MAG: hypothetical protein AAF755_06425 [Pseudomonadota bacterium]
MTPLTMIAIFCPIKLPIDEVGVDDVTDTSFVINAMGTSSMESALHILHGQKETPTLKAVER